MKNKFKYDFEKGFTLIELLVVISIIGVLSSIVLASLKDARDNARNKAYKAEVNQFITALELYRNDNNGKYPGESSTGLQSDFTHYRGTNNTALISLGGAGVDIRPLMSKYIAKVPLSPYISYNNTTLENLFAFDTGSERCIGDTKPVRYIIAVPSTQKGFEDWPYYGNTDGVTPNTAYRCFSLK